MTGIGLRGLAIVLTAGVLTLSGCGGGNTPTGGPAPEVLVSGAEAGVPTPQLRANLPRAPRTLNPITAREEVSRLVSTWLSGTLYRYDRVADQFGPGLATGYTRDEESRAFVIRLRRNIRFSDGSPFTAQDVVATLKAIADPATRSPLRAWLVYSGQPLEFEVIDAHSLRLRAAAPLASLEPLLARLPVLPAALLAPRSGRTLELTSDFKGFAGLGPFIPERWEAATGRLLLRRNPHYWVVDPVGRQLPYAEQVLLEVEPSAAERSRKFRTGETDLIDHLSAADAERLTGVASMRAVAVGPQAQLLAVTFNQNIDLDPRTKTTGTDGWRLAWFGDRHFRRAVAGLIDRGAVARALGPDAVPVSGSFHPQETAWLAPPAETFTPANALRELREGGYVLNRSITPNALYGPNKLPLDFSIFVLAGDPDMEQIGNALERALAGQAIRATMIPLDPDLYFSRQFGPNPDFQCLIFRLDGPAHPMWWREYLHSAGAGRPWAPITGTVLPDSAKQLDSLLDRMLAADDFAGQVSVGKDLQRMLESNQWLIPVLRPAGQFGINAAVGNVRLSYRCPSVLWNLEELFKRR